MTEFASCVGKQLIGGEWVDGAGSEWSSVSPIDAQATWQGHWANQQQAGEAVAAASQAFESWALESVERRTELCRAFAELVECKRDELAELIAWETGKPRWEALTEVSAVANKVANAIDAQRARRWTTVEKQGPLSAVTRYKPHGVMLVLGPFNLPAHLPGAHIVPALLAGNTVVFKPSEMAPAVGQWLATAWQQAGLPNGVLNLVHGDAAIARALASDDRVAGVLFTGSSRAGVALHQLLAGKPEKVLALEMGGNNPLVVHNVSDMASAVMQIIESAYITSGQRCTCARRLIITESSQPHQLIEQLAEAIQQIRIGLPFDEPQPYLGPLIRPGAATQMLAAQRKLLQRGAHAIEPMHPQDRNPALLSPGLIDVTNVEQDDEEHFGPMLSVIRVGSFDQAIQAANATRFGLAAGLLADSPKDFEYFCDRVRAGIVNWNRQTTGASGRLPFGGIGASGNHAPSGFFAADYCAYPVASLESEHLPEVGAKVPPGLEGVVRLYSS